MSHRKAKMLRKLFRESKLNIGNVRYGIDEKGVISANIERHNYQMAKSASMKQIKKELYDNRNNT